MQKITPMALEDEIPKFNNGGGGGKRGVGRPASKMPKPKKVPQRGLGVAQLEKIRVEEEKKEKAATTTTTTKVGLSSSSNSPYDMHLQFLKFHQSNQPPSSNSWPSNSISLNNGGNSNACWHSVPIQGHAGGPHNRSHIAFQFDKKNFGMDPRILPVESNPVRSLPNRLQAAQQKPTLSMVNVSSGASSTIVHHSSLEPRSSLNYSTSYNFKNQEERVTGIKRPYPFSMNILPAVSSSNFKPLTFLAPVKASETISHRSGRGFNLDFTNSTIREIPLSTTSNSQMIISKKSKKDNKKFGEDFLSLAPPMTCSDSKLKSPAFPPFNHQFKEKMKDQVSLPGCNKQQHWNNLIPRTTMVAQTGQQSSGSYNDGVREENIDLDLTLKL